jgi:hypothetical protein
MAFSPYLLLYLQFKISNMKKISILSSLFIILGSSSFAQSKKKSKSSIDKNSKVAVVQELSSVAAQQRTERSKKTVLEYGRLITLPKEIAIKRSNEFIDFYEVPDTKDVFQLLIVDRDDEVSLAPLRDGSVVKTDPFIKLMEPLPQVTAMMVNEQKAQVFTYRVLYNKSPKCINYAFFTQEGINRVLVVLSDDPIIQDQVSNYVANLLNNDALTEALR